MAEGTLPKPKVWDPLLEILSERGAAHQQNYIEHLTKSGLEVADQPGPEIFAHAWNLAEILKRRVQYAERISTRNGKPEAFAVELITEDKPPARASLAVAFGDR